MKKKILVVDDEPDVLAIFKKKLEAQGFNTVTAKDGEEGFDRAVSEKPDLILLDIIMPKRDGFALLKDLQLKEQTKRIPVIMLSAQTGADSLMHSQGLGATDYLIKPVDFQELLKYIRKYI